MPGGGGGITEERARGCAIPSADRFPSFPYESKDRARARTPAPFSFIFSSRTLVKVTRGGARPRPHVDTGAHTDTDRCRMASRIPVGQRAYPHVRVSRLSRSRSLALLLFFSIFYIPAPAMKIARGRRARLDHVTRSRAPSRQSEPRCICTYTCFFFSFFFCAAGRELRGRRYVCPTELVCVG